MTPRVSVVIPLYNGERYIREAIESVLLQTVQDYEVIVVDDGSSDGGKDIVRSLGGPIKYLYQENGGVTRARNEGVLNSQGQYLAFLDQDDRWYPQKLEIQLRILDENPLIGTAYSDIDLIDEAGNVIEHKCLRSSGRPTESKRKIIQTIFSQYPNPHPFPSTVMIRRQIFEQAGMFDPAFKRNCYEDKELWFRIGKRGLGQFFFYPDPLVQRRSHPSQGERNQEAREENWVVYLKKLSHLYSMELQSDAELHRQFIEWIVNESRRLGLQKALKLYGDKLEADSELGAREFIQRLLNDSRRFGLEKALGCKPLLRTNRKLRRKLSVALSREGKQLIKQGEFETGRRYLKAAFLYNPAYLKNLGRLIRSCLGMRAVIKKYGNSK